MVFLLKSAKKMCICDYVKNRIVTCENVCFGLEKGISKFLHQVAPKHTADIPSVVGLVHSNSI